MALYLVGHTHGGNAVLRVSPGTVGELEFGERSWSSLADFADEEEGLGAVVVGESARCVRKGSR